MLERGLDAGVLSVEQINAMEPVGRMGTPEEIAESVLWLMSDESSFVTGHPLSIDGGYVAR
jgi:NAD(P)-dependent dehydrogenase (short-subunit alcohol dehydrogenase family)